LEKRERKIIALEGNSAYGGSLMIKMRTRKWVAWLIVILIGGPVAAFVFKDLPTLVDNAKLLAEGLLITSLAIGSWRLKKRLKRRMARGLGRDVDDIELVSITRWMQIPDEARRAARDAERHDFSD
jgi:hypothetical protein